jgi:hypothetical protein
MASTASKVLLGRGAFDVSDQTRNLTFRIDGGDISLGGGFTRVLNATLELPNNATSFVEVTPAGVVSSNTTGFTAGRSYLYKVVTLNGQISEIHDWRHGDIDAAPVASGGAAPAGGTGAAAGAYDTAAHRDSLIALVNNMRTVMINNGWMT